MRMKFLIFIIVVLVGTIGFGLLMYRQLGIFEKNALAAKQRHAEYMRQQRSGKDGADENDIDPYAGEYDD